MLKRFLGERDDAFCRPDADVLPLAVQVLHQRFGCFGDVCLECVHRAINN